MARRALAKVPEEDPEADGKAAAAAAVAAVTVTLDQIGVQDPTFKITRVTAEAATASEILETISSTDTAVVVAAVVVVVAAVVIAATAVVVAAAATEVTTAISTNLDRTMVKTLVAVPCAADKICKAGRTCVGGQTCVAVRAAMTDRVK